ncbi:MAG: hypothetical protein ABII23_00360 [bacterium]
MKKIIIAVLLSGLVGPGMGQLYNRDFKKAWALIAATLIIFFLLFFAVINASYSLIPAGNIEINYKQYIELKEKLSEKHPTPFRLYGVIMTGIWIYGIIDAYIVAKRKNRQVVS